MDNPVTMRKIAKNPLILFFIPGFLFLPILNCCLIKSAAASTPFFLSYAHPGGERGHSHCAGRERDTDAHGAGDVLCKCVSVAAIVTDQRIGDMSFSVKGFDLPPDSLFHNRENDVLSYRFPFYFFQRFRSRTYTGSVPLYLAFSDLRI
jgi:hypothetical protein